MIVGNNSDITVIVIKCNDLIVVVIVIVVAGRGGVVRHRARPPVLRIFESKFRNHCSKKLDGALRRPTSFV